MSCPVPVTGLVSRSGEIGICDWLAKFGERTSESQRLSLLKIRETAVFRKHTCYAQGKSIYFCQKCCKISAQK